MTDDAEKRRETLEQSEEQEISLEQAFARLDELMAALEDKDTSLEEAFSLYRKGMDLVRICSEKIGRVEEKVLVINEDGEIDEF